MADWITTDQAVELTGYHPRHIRRLLRGRMIKGQKWGREWQISRSSLMAYVREVKKLGERRGPKREA